MPILWPLIFESGHQIAFAHTSFKWANLASYNAGVTVVIVGLSKQAGITRQLYSVADGKAVIKEAGNINAYLVAGENVIVDKLSLPPDQRSQMEAGGKPVEGGNLLFTEREKQRLITKKVDAKKFIKRVYGASEYIRGEVRSCLWILDSQEHEAKANEEIRRKLNAVAIFRLRSPKTATKKGAAKPHKFEEVKQTGCEIVTIIPKVSSESREYLPVGLLPNGSIVTDLAFALYDAPLWNMALIASRLHLVWIATVCGKLKTDFRYSNTLGWNTFPVPPLTAQNKADLTECAENILLARERHFPATIAELYAPEKMPDNLQRAHAQNDESLERIYLGRLFKNDTERLEKLFELYTQMTAENKPRRLAQ